MCLRVAKRRQSSRDEATLYSLPGRFSEMMVRMPRRGSATHGSREATRATRLSAAIMVNTLLATNRHRMLAASDRSRCGAVIGNLGICTEKLFNQVVALKAQCGMGAEESSGVA